MRADKSLSYLFKPQLKEGVIVSRPNRFIMIIESEGRTLRCHCPSTGRLGNLTLPGLRCLYSTSRSRIRKTGYTVEAISLSRDGRDWAGINQNAANRYFEYFLREGALSRLATGPIQREVPLGKSRIDFLVGDTYIEVKTPLIQLPAERGLRGVKHRRFDSFDRLIRHMNELRAALVFGRKAKVVLCYLYDARPFVPPAPDRTNRRILYAARAAEAAGVERWQVNFRLSKEGVSLIRYFRSKPYRK